MKKPPQRIDLEPEQTEAILERVKAALGDGDYQIIKTAFETIAFLMRLLEKKTTTINRLRQVLFGWRTEKSKKVLKEDKKKDSPDAASDKGGKSSEQENDTNKPDKKKKTKSKGHGRNGADVYSAADKVKISHAKLRSGIPCPVCPKGKIYSLLDPKRIVRIMGKAPLSATVYELERLRCNLCGKVFTADSPKDITQPSERENTDVAEKKTKVAKYDETAGSMIANMKYGSGFPWYRMEKLQENLGIPLSASTQWDIVEKVANRIHPVFEELKKHAAQGEVIHNDDTIMKVMELMNPPGKQSEQGQKKTGRSGVFTTGILSIKDQRKTALFYTGTKHAGENLEDLLKKRDEDRSPPIQMCDALSRNTPKAFQTLVANCLAHGRRKFVEVNWAFPEQCRYVLEILKKVYINDDIARKQDMSAEERLKFHKEKSEPFMKKLHIWLKWQLEEKKVEPNSGVGQAISYLLNHWKELTLFLRVSKAPLDNNICERALKRAILHRKNSLFYKTKHGAYIGDLFMSLIHTCHLNFVNAFKYLTTLQKHSCELFKNPEKWLPWNYEKTLLSSAF